MCETPVNAERKMTFRACELTSNDGDTWITMRRCYEFKNLNKAIKPKIMCIEHAPEWAQGVRVYVFCCGIPALCTVWQTIADGVNGDLGAGKVNVEGTVKAADSHQFGKVFGGGDDPRTFRAEENRFPTGQSSASETSDPRAE